MKTFREFVKALNEMQYENIDDVVKSMFLPKLEEWKSGKQNFLLKVRDEYREKSKGIRDSYQLKKIKDDIGISKKDFDMIMNMNPKMWDDELDKESKQKYEKIEYAIKNKIKDKILEIKDVQMKYGHDGYVEGIISLETDKGPKILKVETIIAGGYNVQSRHYRTKVYYN